MKRRQAKKIVERTFTSPIKFYPSVTWQRVIKTMTRCNLVFYGKGDWGKLP